jgi:hypothetical protein
MRVVEVKVRQARALDFDVVGSLNVILLFPGSPVELADVVFIYERQSKFRPLEGQSC